VSSVTGDQREGGRPIGALEANGGRAPSVCAMRRAIQTQQQAGLVTEAQARQQIVALQLQSAPRWSAVPTMKQAALAIGPDAVIRVQAWRMSWRKARSGRRRTGTPYGIASARDSAGTGRNDHPCTVWPALLASIFQQVADDFLQKIVIQPFRSGFARQARMLALKSFLHRRTSMRSQRRQGRTKER
jgi:uncharacterized protein YbjQ (UPF0145 family)